jgi:UDP-2,3-diacylglucosamine pyrophosphatase LpxH
MHSSRGLSNQGDAISLRTTIILSDLHAGAEESLLSVLGEDDTVDPIAVSRTTTAFGTAMRATLSALSGEDAHHLVILGDALDLSLAPPQVAAGVFRGFMAALPPQMLGGRMSFVPGNHDHALWTAQRFADGPGAPDEAGHWAHVTPAFAAPETRTGSATLNALMPAGHAQVKSYYPNLGLGPVTTATERRAVMLHHGHFIETAYSLMTRFCATLSGVPAPAMTADRLETVNGSWIDFAWSTFGDTGPLGREIARAEQGLVTGGGARLVQDRMAAALARGLQASLPLPRSAQVSDTLQQLARGLVDSFVGSYSEMERFSYTAFLSRASQQGLHAYIDEVVADQMLRELDGAPGDTRLTFIFGHTHKPFADQIVTDGFRRPVTVYNTGGWVLDTALLSTVEGAAVAFVDAQMNTALLTLYSLGGDGILLAPAVSSADPVADADNPMRTALQAAVASADAEWSAFREAVRADLETRQAMYLRRAGDGTAKGGVA